MNQAQIIQRFVTQAFRAGKANAQALVESFHVKHGHRVHDPKAPETLTLELLALRQKLLIEETGELCDELDYAPWNVDRARVAKEAADVLYVVYGLCVSVGIDAQRALELVHASNMTKPVHNSADNIKTPKGEGYEPPDMTGALL